MRYPASLHTAGNGMDGAIFPPEYFAGETTKKQDVFAEAGNDYGAGGEGGQEQCLKTA